jgi:hypothetical protein
MQVSANRKNETNNHKEKKIKKNTKGRGKKMTETSMGNTL